MQNAGTGIISGSKSKAVEGVKSSVIQSEFWQKAYRWASRRVVYHSLTWGVVLMALTLFEMAGSNRGFWFVMTNNLIRLAIFCMIVYFNYLYLIPTYLNKKKFRTYFILLALFVIIITPLENLVLYFKFREHPDLQSLLLKDLNLSFVPNFIFAGVSTLVKIVTDWVKYTREKQAIATQTMQSELKFLKSQINPHFLFNTLNNLYALTLKKSDKAPEIVIKLSEMMRYMLYECNEKQVPLSKEVNYLKNYLDLESLRQGKNVDIRFRVNGEVSDQKIAPLMFIPFLENSFKHGLNNHISKGFVNIEMDVEPDRVRLYIENSKPATMPRPTRRKSGGIGLVNVKRRLDLLYPGKYQLRIDDNPNTYAVTMEIELN
ncbi:MAG: histidine kinase [Bacteroidetes bacterium]|nr:MAG: histidine kinase [Bacteroidota bacterium]